MVWVRSEYAGELAVLSAWLAALVPWNVTYSTGVLGGSALFVRFPFFQVRYLFGVPIGQAVLVEEPLSALASQSGTTLAVAYQAWVAGAVVMGAAVVLSVAYYLREEQVEAGPVDPVRLMGGLLGLAGLVLAAATYLLAENSPFAGVPLPVGVVVTLVLAGMLLRVERTDTAVPDAEGEGDVEREADADADADATPDPDPGAGAE
jgi:hypothetical protein